MHVAIEAIAYGAAHFSYVRSTFFLSPTQQAATIWLPLGGVLQCTMRSYPNRCITESFWEHCCFPFVNDIQKVLVCGEQSIGEPLKSTSSCKKRFRGFVTTVAPSAQRRRNLKVGLQRVFFKTLASIPQETVGFATGSFSTNSSAELTSRWTERTILPQQALKILSMLQLRQIQNYSFTLLLTYQDSLHLYKPASIHLSMAQTEHVPRRNRLHVMLGMLGCCWCSCLRGCWWRPVSTQLLTQLE